MYISPKPIGKYFLAIALLLANPVYALGQSEASANPEPRKVTVLPPAYDPQMMRLSEILGALHYLRELCGANEGQLWRNEMSNLIDKEDPTEDRRAKMIARFNQGFRGFQETYRECTPAAIEANRRYIEEGEKLSQEIPSRYGR
ncbi:MAG: TIGR02301 family protein [Rhizobiaceae bacterium]